MTDWLAVTDVEPDWDCVGDAVGLRVDEKLCVGDCVALGVPDVD